MTSVELVRSTALTDTVPYAYAAVTPPGRLVFTAGACPLDHDGAVVSPGDVAAQAKQVMANFAFALSAAGAGLIDVAKTTVFVGQFTCKPAEDRDSRGRLHLHGLRPGR